jgi:flagellin
MAIRINGNSTSLNLLRNLNQSSGDLKNTLKALSSGNRITSPSVDPAALMIAKKLASEIQNAGVAARNTSDAMSFLSIADASLGSALTTTNRLEQLAAQASSGTLSDTQRVALNNEFQALSSELDRIQSQAKFNGQSVFGQSVSFQTGTDSSSSSQISVSLTSVSKENLGLNEAKVLTKEDAQDALDALKNARSQVSVARSEVGAAETRLQTSFENLQTQRLNNMEARSRIVDVDVASMSAERTRNTILQQGNVSLMAINNSQSANILQLLKG